jgi:hypothetical protein
MSIPIATQVKREVTKYVKTDIYVHLIVPENDYQERIQTSWDIGTDGLSCNLAVSP